MTIRWPDAEYASSSESQSRTLAHWGGWRSLWIGPAHPFGPQILVRVCSARGCEMIRNGEHR